MATQTLTPPRLAGMKAISQATASKNPDLVLGYIVWYSVPDRPVNLVRFKRAWMDAGLDKTPMRATQTKIVNAFQRAVRSLEGITRNEPTIDPDTGLRVVTTTETDVRELKNDAKEVQYQVTRVVRDLKGMVVKYPPAVRIRFDKDTEQVRHHSLGGVDAAGVSEIMDRFHESFEQAGKTLPGSKVRTMVRKYLSDDRDERDKLWGLGGENLRGKAGGIYFVPAKHESVLDDIASMLSRLWRDRSGYLYKVPMADGASEREMIKRAHVMNSVQDAKLVMFDVGELLREDRKRAVRDDVRKKAWRRLERAQWRAAEYAQLLGDEQEEVQTALHGMQRQLRKLTGL